VLASHSRNGREGWAYLAELVGGEEPEEDLANGPMGTWAAGSGRPVVAAREGERERERALGER